MFSLVRVASLNLIGKCSVCKLINVALWTVTLVKMDVRENLSSVWSQRSQFHPIGINRATWSLTGFPLANKHYIVFIVPGQASRTQIYVVDRWVLLSLCHLDVFSFLSMHKHYNNLILSTISLYTDILRYSLVLAFPYQFVPIFVPLVCIRICPMLVYQLHATG